MYGAAVFSAWLGGIGPGLLAAVLGVLVVDYLLTPPLYAFTLDVEDLARLTVFGLSALLVGWLSVRRRRVNAAEGVREVPPQRRRLVVRSTVEDRDDGRWAVVAVEDAGVGFGEDEAARLFEAFYTTRPGGLGMGLAISRSIMGGHGARLWATANAGHGATFYFALPGIR